MEVDVQSPHVDAKIDEEGDARGVSAGRSEVESRVTEVVCLVRVAAAHRGMRGFTLRIISSTIRGFTRCHRYLKYFVVCRKKYLFI